MTSTTSTFAVSTTEMTVIATDKHGERHNLNAGGEPCETVADLAAFIGELCEQGAYDADTRDALLAQVEA